MEITKNQHKAVDEIVELVVSVMGNGSREIDTTEAISGTARLAGSFLFRSFGLKPNDAKPGTVILSEEANTKGQQLIDMTHAVLHNFGIQIDDSKMFGRNQKEATSNFVDIIAKMQTPALEIMKRNDLDYEQMAESSAIATAFIIQQSGNLTPEEGFGTAIYHYIEGTKTFPPAFSSITESTATIKAKTTENPNHKDVAKPWWKFW